MSGSKLWLSFFLVNLAVIRQVRCYDKGYKIVNSEDGSLIDDTGHDDLLLQLRLQRRDVSAAKQAVSKNGTEVTNVNHTYYTSTHYAEGSTYFLDLRNLHMRNHSDVYFHTYLTNSYGRAHTRKLKFNFPYYGHIVDKVSMTTGGFLHIGPVFHSFITDTHYVAPLMANFNPRVSGNGPESRILVYDDGSRFVTQWDSVSLDDQRSHGRFTFQVSIFPNGTFIFAYKTIPVPLASISTVNHPVRVGLSDAFIFTFKYRGLTHRKIYRYHTVKLDSQQVQNGSAFVVHPVRTCVTAKSCNECLSGNFPGFRCAWCGKLSLCSDTFDWNRQSWTNAGCRNVAIKNATFCNGGGSSGGQTGRHKIDSGNGTSSRISPGATVGIIFLVLLMVIILAVVSFYLYAHTHPNTSAGLYVIEHGPRTWFKKKSENC